MPRKSLLSFGFILLVLATTAAAQQAQQAQPAQLTPPPRPTPPTRAPDGAGAPKFTRVAPGGNAPVDQNGDYLIGPDYLPPQELNVVDGVPQGKVEQFTMSSADSKFYPGIARDVFGTVDPNNPKTLVVETHAQPWERAITVYVPAQYKHGKKAPFIVTHDGPRLDGVVQHESLILSLARHGTLPRAAPAKSPRCAIAGSSRGSDTGCPRSMPAVSTFSRPELRVGRRGLESGGRELPR